MTLKELLDELRTNVLRDVSSEVGSNASSGYLWSDASLIRYINDAEQKFARRTRCLRDSTTPEVVEVVLEEGVDTYPMDARVIGVLSAKIGTIPLRRSMDGALAGAPRDFANGTVTVHGDTRGRPVWFTTDEAVRTLRVYPIPDAATAGMAVRMRVERLPLAELTSSTKNAEPEIPRDYHLDLLEWAAWRAYRNHDVDGENMHKANSHKAAFERAIADAKHDIRMQALAPAQFAVDARYD